MPKIFFRGVHIVQFMVYADDLNLLVEDINTINKRQELS
jgi:hypothetical protein